MKKTNSFIKNQKGFSLVQVLVSSLLMVLLVAMFTSMYLKISTTQSQMQTTALDTADTRLAEQLIFKDFNGAGASFNVVKQMDNNNKSFYEFDASYSCAGEDSNYRVKTISPGKDAFYILTEEKSKSPDGDELSPLKIYDAIEAYDVSDTDVLTFVSINKKDYLKKSANPNFWRPNQLLLFDMTAHLTPSTGGAARSPIFLGMVGSEAPATNAQFNKVIYQEVLDHFYQEDPRDGKTYSNVDEFLRRAPTVGGGQPIVRAMMVKITKYFVSTDKKLIRQEFKNDTFTGNFVLADKVSSVDFIRPSGCQRVMKVRVNKLK